MDEDERTSLASSAWIKTLGGPAKVEGIAKRALLLRSAALAAARAGHVLARPKSTTLDALDVLVEIGGTATVYEVRAHTGTGTVSTVHVRYQRLLARGLVTVTGSGRQYDPLRYCIAPAGETLLRRSER